jgi:hypothetical protein
MELLYLRGPAFLEYIKNGYQVVTDYKVYFLFNT